MRWASYWTFVVFLGFVILCGYLLELDNTLMHEGAHVQVMKNNGCLDADFELTDLGMTGATMCNDYSNYDFVEAERFHSLNEIFGYQVANLMRAVFLGFVILAGVVLFGFLYLGEVLSR